MVTSDGLAENQDTLAVTSGVDPPAVALTVRQFGGTAVELAEREIEVGEITRAVTFANVTVAVVVAVAVPEAAVMVLVPAATAVSSPPVLTVAIVLSEVDQHTVVPAQLVPDVRVIEFPLLSVPAAVNCTGVPPTLTVGLGGSITILETVGFTKNPLQLTATAKVASAAMAPAKRSFCLGDDIVIWDSLGAPSGLNSLAS